jgi:ParB family transcriptional regulator, chromosome partitioning protein
MSRNALGRGLSALIREPEPPPSPAANPPSPPLAAASQAAPDSVGVQAAAVAVAAAPSVRSEEGYIQVDIDLIDPSPFQPRTRFREEALEELARSIRGTGIVQPLIVRKQGNRYQLIAGERRWRAAQRCAFPKVPVVVRDVSEAFALEMTLVENLQREDLNPIEEASAFEKLIHEFHLTQEQAADRTGKDRATVANSLRLTKLDKPIQELLEDGKLSAGHGRALLGIMDPRERISVAKRAAKGGMTVRQIEKMATRAPRQAPLAPPPLDANTKAAIQELEYEFGTRVTINQRTPKQPGELIFEFYSDEDLVRIYDRLLK